MAVVDLTVDLATADRPFDLAGVELAPPAPDLGVGAPNEALDGHGTEPM